MTDDDRGAVRAGTPTAPLIPGVHPQAGHRHRRARTTSGPTTASAPRSATAAAAGDGVVEGDLFLVGGGDPVLGTADLAASFRPPARPASRRSRRWPTGVVAAGVREVRGAVVGDESRYDQERYRPTWPARYRVNVEIGP